MIQELKASNFILQNIDLNSAELKGSKHDMMCLLIKAVWCGHCKSYYPQYEQFSKTASNIGFMVLESTDHDNETLLGHWKNLVNPAFEVSGFPTVIIYNAKGTPVKVVNDRMNILSEIEDAKSA